MRIQPAEYSLVYSIHVIKHELLLSRGDSSSNHSYLEKRPGKSSTEAGATAWPYRS